MYFTLEVKCIWNIEYYISIIIKYIQKQFSLSATGKFAICKFFL